MIRIKIMNLHTIMLVLLSSGLLATAKGRESIGASPATPSAATTMVVHVADDVETDLFAKCVPDGHCPSSPDQDPRCTGGAPGQSCEMCEYQRSREKCVFSASTTCVYTDLGGDPEIKLSGCGRRWVGSCLGGANSPCIAPQLDGFCERILCNSA